MITCIIVAILFAAIIQKDSEKKVTGLVFATATASHDLLFSHLDGLLYYWSDSLLFLAVISIISTIRPVNYLTIFLQRASIAAILLNIAGFSMWYLYYPPTIYNWSFTFLYLCVLAVLLQRSRDSNDLEIHSVGGIYPGVRRDTAASN